MRARGAWLAAATSALLGCQSPGRAPATDADAALSHGRDQLRRMLEDRPVMALHVREGDDIWDWAVRGYAGTDLGFLVYWERAAPKSGAEANHTFPRPGQVALLRIRTKEEPSTDAFENAWCSFVYEIENLKNAKEYLAAHEGAVGGRLDRSEYVRRNTRLEFLAIERTRRFYSQVWAPWCRDAGVSPTPREWYVGGAATYDEWMKTQSGLKTAEFWASGFAAKFAARAQPE